MHSLFSLLLLLTAAAPPLLAQNNFSPDAPAAGANVSVSLISDQDGIVAGKPFTVALKMEHKEHWHTYWINPGIGQATAVKWKLPEGFTAGPIIWPVPLVKETEIGNQHIYGDTKLLLTEITPPASLTAGAKVTIAGAVSWLCCDEGESCVPGQKDVSLALSVKEPVVNAQVKRAFDDVRDQQPRPSEAWKVETADSGTQTVITLTPDKGANPVPGAIYFFDRSGVIENEPQNAVAKGGKFILTLKKREAVGDETSVPPPSGFLFASSGWLKNGTQHALAVTIKAAAPAKSKKAKE